MLCWIIFSRIRLLSPECIVNADTSEQKRPSGASLRLFLDLAEILINISLQTAMWDRRGPFFQGCLAFGSTSPGSSGSALAVPGDSGSFSTLRTAWLTAEGSPSINAPRPTRPNMHPAQDRHGGGSKDKQIPVELPISFWLNSMSCLGGSFEVPCRPGRGP